MKTVSKEEAWQQLADLLEKVPDALTCPRYKGLAGNGTNNKLVLIFANPRSGSTLLLRLLNHACLTRCVGDRPVTFYESLMLYHRDVYERAVYCDTVADPSSFPDEFCGYRSPEDHERHMKYVFRIMMFAEQFSHGYCKTTILGWNNNLLVPFVKMARDLFEDDDLRIIWLQRDGMDIAHSFIHTPGSPLYGKKDYFAKICDRVKEQKEQMKEAAQLIDTFITYEQLCEDPMAVLKKCHPVYEPNPKTVEKIMAIKTRS